MKTVTTVLQMLVRLAGLCLIVLGVLFWTGNAFSLLRVHMLLGFALVIGLWTLAGLAARAGVHPGWVALAVLWGFVVPVLGMIQDRLLPGNFHWLIKVLHLLVGIAAIAQAERLAAGIRRRPTAAPPTNGRSSASSMPVE